MDIFECITTRRSIRNFKSKKVDKDDLFLLVEAGMYAPTAGNLQDFRFIVTNKQKIINEVATHCMEQGWISKATGLIVICSQPKLQREWYGPKGDRIFAVQNAAAAAQNILLAANAIGLGACWVSGFDQEAIDNLFKTSSKARVEVIIPVGYPNEKPDKKSMEQLDIMMYFDEYGNKKSDVLKINKDYSAIIERNIRKIPAKTESLKEKITYLINKVNYQIKNKKETEDSEDKKNSK
ncbi:MAG: nitroreductase family protein [Candidatus Woesearchaeota archaeon]